MILQFWCFCNETYFYKNDNYTQVIAAYIYIYYLYTILLPSIYCTRFAVVMHKELS